MRLYVARHGETDLNLHGDCYQGSTDLPLNLQGFEQAKALAQRLPRSIDHVVSSPLLRARQTAEVLAHAMDLPLTLMEQFRERDFGVFEGLSSKEAQLRYPEVWARGSLQQWDEAPPGAETTREVVRRVGSGLQLLQRRHPQGSVALVAHGFVVRALRFLLDGIPEEQFFVRPKIGNGEFLCFESVSTAAGTFLQGGARRVG